MTKLIVAFRKFTNAPKIVDLPVSENAGVKNEWSYAANA
jgi:hypothetical protein